MPRMAADSFTSAPVRARTRFALWTSASSEARLAHGQDGIRHLWPNRRVVAGSALVEPVVQRRGA